MGCDSQFDGLWPDKPTATDEKRELIATINKLTEENDALRNELSYAELSVGAIHDKHDRFKESVDALVAENETLHADNVKLTRKVVRLKGEVKALRKVIRNK